MSYPRLSVLIPAAGVSKRLGQPKQLLRYKKKTLIQHAVETAHSITPREIIVVTGANAEAVKGAFQTVPVCWVHNPDWSAGMGRSIATGIAGINPESTGVMILLCDQWRILTSDLKVLAEEWQSDPKRIVCAEANGQLMPPVIFPASCFGNLQALDGDSGARSIIKSYPELLTTIASKNAAFDMDTPSQLNHL
ncbi:MAG: nucleotidyltransferase family protein [Xanthomonadales bacterium]|nr:nucleotidyltransferase family protein [Xanthomonadales bacterium]